MSPEPKTRGYTHVLTTLGFTQSLMVRVTGSEPDDMGSWSVQILSLEDGQVSIVVSLCGEKKFDFQFGMSFRRRIFWSTLLTKH